MNTSYNLFDEMPGDALSNPFAELRTIPGGWDMSAMPARHNGRHAQPSSPPAVFPRLLEWKPDLSEHSLRQRLD
jgi:hypothetical protein